jgi:hypothetical protein
MQLHNLFISAKYSTCFGQFLRPSSGAQKLYIQNLVFVKPLLLPFTVVDEFQLIHERNSSTKVKSNSNGLTNTRFSMYSFWAPDDWQRNCPKHVEHFAEINKLCNVTSCWLYLKIHLRCTDPWTSKNPKYKHSENCFSGRPSCIQTQRHSYRFIHSFSRIHRNNFTKRFIICFRHHAPSSSWHSATHSSVYISIYIYIYIYIYTHTHTHTYTYIYASFCVGV